MIDRSPRAVLFDLDGTLADTAPDLIAALERLRAQTGLPAIDTGGLRAHASRGANAILELGLPELDEAKRDVLRARYLDDYQARCWDASRPFEGMCEFLDALDAAGVAWGVVTNKLAQFARPVIEQAGWAERVGCLIAGDTTGRAKPSPDPVLAACSALDVDPRRVVFVGDDERDVIAGRAAGTRTIAALWGYIPSSAQVVGWGADAMAEAPASLHDLLGVRRYSVSA